MAVNRLSGGHGNDLLDSDSMNGRAGGDRYVVENSADRIIEVCRGGADSVSASIIWTLGARLV